MHLRPGGRLRYLIGLAVLLAGTWLIWSGHFDALLLSLGAASVGGVLAIAHRMHIVDREALPVQIALRGVYYLPWLFWQIAKANLDVAARIVRPRMPIDPRVVRVKAGQVHDVYRVIYANSITLTPGTVSIDIEGDEITVHALTAEAARDVESGEMDRRVSRLEGSR